ncbi:MAG: FecR family protein [Chitinophagaceae bacterium]|nr:MAG: FecR family protein [Chitinophagaceae bacterium]
MSTDRLQYLLDKLFHRQCSQDEKEELSLWIDTVPDDEEWKERLSRIWNSFGPSEKMEPSKADSVLKEILKKGTDKPANVKALKPRYTSVSGQMMRWSVAAAAIIGILIILSVIYLSKRPPTASRELASNNNITGQNDIKPGGNKATLTLANGKIIVLDSIHNGLLTNQHNSNIIKVSSGLISYNINRRSQITDHSSQIEYNTLSTPLGGQYQLILPDGSKVWLNAGSSLKFPVVFSGKGRMVMVSGEAYFEIARNSNMPFVVHITSPDGKDKGIVEVLGTNFNIDAYNDESNIKTTLIDGSIKVLNGNDSKMLAPGEQAEMKGNGGIQLNKEINLNEVIAWKNGLFDFEGNNIEEVMQQLAKWYDIKVDYQNVPSTQYVGTISRNSNISEVLKMLEMTGTVHFKVEGRTVTVMQ